MYSRVHRSKDNVPLHTSKGSMPLKGGVSGRHNRAEYVHCVPLLYRIQITQVRTVFRFTEVRTVFRLRHGSAADIIERNTVLTSVDRTVQSTGAPRPRNAVNGVQRLITGPADHNAFAGGQAVGLDD